MYEIDKKPVRSQCIFFSLFIFFGIMGLYTITNGIITEISDGIDAETIPLLIMSVFFVLAVVGGFIVLPIHTIRSSIKDNRRLDYLARYGTLIPNLPYHLEESPLTYDDSNIHEKWAVIDYTTPSGEHLSLHGRPQPINSVFKDHPTVDLLIDQNDPTNYYIDFKIVKSGEISPSVNNQPL